MIHAYQKGSLKKAPDKIKEIAKHISFKDAKDFAATKHHGLPEKKAMLEKTAYERLAHFAEGVFAACQQNGVDLMITACLVKAASDQFMSKLAAAPGAAVPGLSKPDAWATPGPAQIMAQKAEQAQTQEQPNTANQQQIQPDPPAAPPSHPFDFANDYDVRMALAIRKDHLKKQMKDAEKVQQQAYANQGVVTQQQGMAGSVMQPKPQAPTQEQNPQPQAPAAASAPAPAGMQ